MMMDYLLAGAQLRRAASITLAAAQVLMSEARRNCEMSERDTRKSLSELDEQRQRVSGELATVYPLYRLAGLDNPGRAAKTETECLPTMLFDEEDRLPSAPSAPLWIAIGASGGGAVGAAAILVAGVAAPFGWTAAVLGGALVAGMFAGVAQGRRALAAAREYVALAQKWQKQATSYGRENDRIRRFAAMSMQLNEALVKKLDAREAELEEVAHDTVNAAILLKDVLNTALLNEEGAFLDEVIEQLHEQKERISGFADRIAVSV